MDDKYLDKLKENGLKITPKRVETLRILSQQSVYLSPIEIRALLLEKFTKVGLPTVYRILQQFEEIGIVSVIKQDDNQLYYFLCDCSDQHHHFVCRKCHKVSCITYCDFEHIKKLVFEQLGSHAETHVLQVEGLCKECKESP